MNFDEGFSNDPPAALNPISRTQSFRDSIKLMEAAPPVPEVHTRNSRPIVVQNCLVTSRVPETTDEKRMIRLKKQLPMKNMNKIKEAIDK